MKVTKVRLKVDSENIHIPELKKFIGKTAEMVITEVSPEKQKMKRFFDAVGKIKIDEEVIREWREVSKP